jgi:predicted exporter
MGRFADYALQALGVRVPEDYSSFMEIYGQRLSEDPVLKRAGLAASVDKREMAMSVRAAAQWKWSDSQNILDYRAQRISM